MRSTSAQLDSPLVARVAIAQAALDTFGGKPFEWGKMDCARLAAHVLRGAGYKPKLSQFGDYCSDGAARRALKARGMASVLDWMDSLKLVRIAPAAALVGDLIAFPGAGGWDGLAVVLGNGRVLAFTETADAHACSIIAANLEAAVAAWSVPPCRNS